VKGIRDEVCRQPGHCITSRFINVTVYVLAHLNLVLRWTFLLTVVATKNFFRDVKSCSLVDIYRRLGGTYCLLRIVVEPEASRPYFIVLILETPLTWKARSPYLYPPGTGWLSYIPGHWVPFPSPLTTRRAAVEVFYPASTRGKIEVEVTLRPTVSPPVHLCVSPLLEQVTRCYIYLSDNYFLYFSCRAPYLTRGRVCNLQSNDASSISSYIATDGLSASSSWCRAPQWGP
jgi:hypothetical protein